MTAPARSLMRLSTLLAFCLGVVWLGSAVAQTPPPPPPPQEREVEREALREEIRRYSALVQAMRESLAVHGQDDFQDEAIETTVRELSSAVGLITDQLTDLELDVEDNQLSLRDGRGGEVTLEIPEDLPEQLSSGLSAIVGKLLEEMPDTVRIGNQETGFTFDLGNGGLQFQPVRQRRARRVVEGGLLKIRDDLGVSEDEDVHGDAVAIMGDAVIEGRVLGDVIVVLGDVELADTAEVEGRVVSILGRLDRADGARVGSVTVINPAASGVGGDLANITRGWGSFLAFQGLFLMLLILVLLLVGFAPSARRERLLSEAQDRALMACGLGLLALLVGHAAVVGLSAILVLTVIGIPVALLALGVLLLLDLAAIGCGALAVGRHLCGRLGLSCPRPWRELILGMLVLHAPSFMASVLGALGVSGLLTLPVVWLGVAFKLVVFCYGLGALLITRFGSRGTRRPLTTGLDALGETPAG